MLRSLARTAPRAIASALIALIAITAPEGAAAAGHFDLQRPIRVAVTIADPERIALSLPDGATATVGSRPLDLGNAASEIIIARSGWRISMPVRPPPVRGSNAVSRSEPSTFAYGSYPSQAAAWRLRRLVHAEFGIMPPVECARTHMAVNGKTVLGAMVSVTVWGPDAGESLIGLDGSFYRGQIEISVGESGVAIINTLPLEQYLYSVVGGEMPSNWHIEALKAQAVAARTYAVRRIDPDARFDVCDTTLCQVYPGFKSESASTRLAVDSTAGLIAVYDGRSIDALYSANMGGHSADSEDVWGNEVAYLRAVPSQTDAEALNSSWGAESYVWEKVIGTQDLAASMRRFGYPVQGIEGIRVVEKTAAGRVLDLAILSTPTAVRLHRDEIRSVLGISSTVFVARVEPGRTIILISPPITLVRHHLERGNVVGRARRSISFDEIPRGIRSVDGSVFVRALQSPSTVIINGRGLGHGLGMSQWGALGMAKQGDTFDKILRHYYSGIDLVPIEAAVNPA